VQKAYLKEAQLAAYSTVVVVHCQWSSVSLVPTSKVICQLLHASLWSFRSQTSLFRQPLQIEYSAVLSQDI